MKKKFTFLTAAFMLLAFLAVPLGMRGQTYKLQQVTSVEAGGLYVFEQGGYVMNNNVSSSALQTTDSYNTTGLEGSETYVWTLETATSGFYMKNVSLNSNQYLNNASSTGVTFGNTSSIWAFNFQTDNTVLIQNKSNSNRFLGYTTSTSHAYKAYATSNLSNYPHAIKVYKLVEEGSNPTVAIPTFSPAAGVYTSAQNVTISTTTTGADIYYTTDGSDPTTSSTQYIGAISVSSNTTIKAMATASGYDNSSIATAKYVFVEHAGTATDPYSVADARTAIDANMGVTGVYATGIVSEIVTPYDPTYHNISYNISTDGTTTADQLQAYRGKSFNGEDFTSADDIQVGDFVVVKGNLTKYGSTYEFAQNNQLVSLKRITVDLASINLTYIEENGPAEEDLAITGTGLTQSFTANITQEGSYFEMTDGTNTGTSLTIPAAGGVITVRLRAGLSHGDYTGTLTLHSEELSNEVVVTLTGSVTNQTYTLTDESGDNGSISFSVSAAEAGAHVTLTPNPASAAYYFVPDSWSFFKDDLTDVTGDIEFVTGETNVIVMPAYNLHVDASFQLKPTYAVTCVASPAAGGEIEASPASAYEGQTVTLSYLPETGYILSSIAITKTSDGTATGITPIASGDDYTFTMPAYAVTATATFLSNTYVGTFEAFSGDLVEGDYLLVYDNKAMNNDDATTSNKLKYANVSPNNNIITNPDRSLVWHIEAGLTSGYWTICNVASNRYVSGAASSTNLTLVSDTSNNSIWQVSGTYDFRCKANEGNSERYIRYHSTNDVFGNYASSNGGALTLYKYQPPVAPVWSSSFPTTATIITNENYSLDVTDYITGTNPTYAIETTATGYTFNSGVFTFSSATAGTYVFTFTATNSAGSDDVTLTIAVNAPAQVNYHYSVNGSLDAGTSITQGNSVTLANGSDIANTDFEFAGWTTDPNDVEHLYSAGSSFLMNNDQIFYAVYSYTTVTGTTTTEASYVKVTNTADITNGNYLIVYEDGAVAFDGSLENMDVASNTIAVDIENGAIAASNTVNSSIFTIASIDGGYSVKSASGLYIGAESYNNELKTSETDPYANSISIDDDENALLQMTFNSSTVTMKFNSASNQNRFRYYKSGQQFIQLYKYTPGSTNSVTTTKYYTRVFLNEMVSGDIEIVGPSIIPSGNTLNMGLHTLTNELGYTSLVIEDGAQLKTHNAVNGTVEKVITGYSSYTGLGHGGYYLLAAPATMDACNNTGMWTSTTSEHKDIDFYYFDQSCADEWQNFKHGNDDFAGPYAMEQGKGYLYANPNDVTLTLQTRGYVSPVSPYVAYPFIATDVDRDVEVSYTSNVDFSGWNLIGNPYTCKAYLADDRDFYRMNAAGDGFIIDTDAAGGGHAINVCEGIFVQTTSAETTVTFTTTEPTPSGSNGNHGMVNISVAQVVNNRGAQPSADFARIRINNGKDMSKFVFNENTSRVYIPKDGKDYAVVRSEAQGELPVNFKAAENGTYTIGIETENLDVEYLHLIDNLTGTDVDLLATPSYSFEARKNDYASRFRLVFSANAGNNEVEDDFAFISDGNIVIANNGEATLQVIDVLGRVVSSQTINGSAHINANTPGVYVLQLINGTNVKTQKIVVK